MKVLIVGAGSVGQIYGYCLQKAGVDLTFYVRPKYVAQLSQGLTLYDLNRPKKIRNSPILFNSFKVISTPEDVAREQWDYVFLCIPSTGLHGEWFPEFIESIGSAVLVSLTPGPDDTHFISQHVPHSQLIRGMITLVSYPAPILGEELPCPGTSFYFPPLAPCPFEGSDELVDPLVSLLKRGGLPAKSATNLEDKEIFPTAIFYAFVGGFLQANGSLQSVQKPERLNAMQEAIKVASLMYNKPIPIVYSCFGPAMIRITLAAANAILPFDVETYLQVHCAKINHEIKRTLSVYVESAQEHDIPTPHLSELLHDIRETPLKAA